ncbi:MAG: cell wall hydrolase [Lachnospira sp.]
MKRQLVRLSALVLFAGMISSAILVLANGNQNSIEETQISTIQNFSTDTETEVIQETTSVIELETEEVTISQYPEFSYIKDWSYEDSYLLAKIAMAEAEGENIQTKTLVILTVLNRVHSDDFPDTIYDVIFDYNEKTGVYQFSPVIPGGRWWTTEPNDECYEAVQVVMESQYDYSGGALFFESCDYDSWHSRNLEFLYQSGNLKFYK